MTILSPSAMEHFKRKTEPLLYDPLDKTKTPLSAILHYTGDIHTLLRMVQTEPAVRPYIRADDEMSWIGCTMGETSKELLETAHCRTAFADFEKAKAELIRPLTRGKPTLSVVGGSFSMGRILIGHPVACYRRPKQKLSPQKVDLALSISSIVKPYQVSSVFAKVVNAAYRYHMAGGPIKLTIHYCFGFDTPNKETKTNGLIISLPIPLTSGSLAAFSGSVQFYRGVAMVIANTFRGCRGGQPVAFLDPKMINLTGKSIDANGVIEQLKINEE